MIGHWTVVREGPGVVQKGEEALHSDEDERKVSEEEVECMPVRTRFRINRKSHLSVLSNRNDFCDVYTTGRLKISIH
jgi:hypothetical protein